MRSLLVLVLLISCSFSVFSQGKVDVYESDKKVDKILRTGIALEVALDRKFVKELWRKKLKEYGKVAGDMSVEIATIPAVSSNNVHLISEVESVGKGCKVWVAIDLGDTWLSKGSAAYKGMEKILNDFGNSCYRADIYEQIKEAEKNLEKKVKEDEKIIKKGDQLVNELDKNAKNKIKLEEEIKKNGEDKITLEEDIEKNKKEQEQSKKTVKEFRKQLDEVKLKLEQIQD